MSCIARAETARMSLATSSRLLLAIIGAASLAKRITDTMTIEKLLTFAGDRRREIEVIAGKYRRA